MQKQPEGFPSRLFYHMGEHPVLRLLLVGSFLDIIHFSVKFALDLAGSIFELADTTTEAAGKLRDTLGTKQQQNDKHNDHPFAAAHIAQKKKGVDHNLNMLIRRKGTKTLWQKETTLDQLFE